MIGRCCSISLIKPRPGYFIYTGVSWIRYIPDFWIPFSAVVRKLSNFSFFFDKKGIWFSSWNENIVCCKDYFLRIEVIISVFFFFFIFQGYFCFIFIFMQKEIQIFLNTFTARRKVLGFNKTVIGCDVIFDFFTRVIDIHFINFWL